MPVAARSVVVFAALLAAACVPPAGPLPEVAHPPEVWRLVLPGEARWGFPTASDSWPTPLSLAVIEDDVEKVRALLEGGADPNARWGGRGDRFPLYEAIHAPEYHRAQQHRGEIVRLLLAHGADPNTPYCPFESRGEHPPGQRPCSNDRPMRPLMAAALFDEWDVAYRLLDAGARPLDLNWFDGSALDLAKSDFIYRLILHAAFLEPDAEGRAAEELYERLALLPDRLDLLRLENPYYFGSHFGRLRLTLRLLQRSDIPADVRRRTLDALLLEAVFDGRGDAIRPLVDAGADPNARWCTAVGRAMAGERFEPDPRCTPDGGVTLLMYAHSWARGTSQALIDAGADPSLKDWAGRTAADYRRLNLSVPAASFILRQQ